MSAEYGMMNAFAARDRKHCAGKADRRDHQHECADDPAQPDEQAQRDHEADPHQR